MCDCDYCQGIKPWSEEPNDWPHTPPLWVFLTLQDKNPNLWWYMADGHRQNIAEDAIDKHEELLGECKAQVAELSSVRAILTDLLAELREYQEDLHATEHALDSFGECLCDGEGADRCTMHNLGLVARMADRAEARLREVTGDE